MVNNERKEPKSKGSTNKYNPDLKKEPTFGNIQHTKGKNYRVGVKHHGKDTWAYGSPSEQTSDGKAMDKKKLSQTQITRTQKMRGFARVGDTQSEKNSYEFNKEQERLEKKYRRAHEEEDDTNH